MCNSTVIVCDQPNISIGGVMNIYEKLNEVRCKLQGASLKKSGRNKFANFSYYELADFLPTVNTLCLESKLIALFSLTESCAVLTVVDAEKPEDRIEFTSPIVNVELKGSLAIQGIGATHTYMKRYLYMNAFELVEADALDAVSGKTNGKLMVDMNSIVDLKSLNKAFYYLREHAPDESWKTELYEKGKELGYRFDVHSGCYV
jgi:hypothetical protein